MSWELKMHKTRPENPQIGDMWYDDTTFKRGTRNITFLNTTGQSHGQIACHLWFTCLAMWNFASIEPLRMARAGR